MRTRPKNCKECVAVPQERARKYSDLFLSDTGVSVNDETAVQIMEIQSPVTGKCRPTRIFVSTVSRPSVGSTQSYTVKQPGCFPSGQNGRGVEVTSSHPYFFVEWALL